MGAGCDRARLRRQDSQQERQMGVRHTGQAKRWTAAAVATWALAGAAAAQAPRLTTEAELGDAGVAAAIDSFWTQRGEARPLTGAGGLELAARRFLQPDRASERGAIVLVSGRTEAMLKYKEVVHDLWRNGFSVYIHDHRGQGQSQREPAVRDQPDIGHVEHFDDYVADLDAWLSAEVLPAGHARVYLWAHSMGGAITARYLQSDRPSVARVQAAVLSSPMLAIAGLVPGLSAEVFSCSLLAHSAVLFGAGASRHWGGRGYAPVGGVPNIYTSSAVRTQRMDDVARDAPLTGLGAPSWGWIAHSCDAARAARDDAAQVRTPLLLVVAGNDRIVLNDGAATFCRRLATARPGAGCGGPDGGPVVVPGAHHELLIERDDLRAQAMGAALDFFARQARPAP
jgi:lysophospholipase